MNMVERVLYLYLWKEELAETLEESQSIEFYVDVFKEFSWWFDAISFERIEPKINDLVEWERKFAEIEKTL